MTRTLRKPTLSTLGLGTVLEIFRNGRLPTDPAALVEEVFGGGGALGSLVISGANGIVGTGKTMQLGSRLQPFGVPVVALDLPGAPDGLGARYPGLVSSFGRERADAIMGGIVRMSYDGKSLPAELKDMKPRFLLEAIPEILELKKAHYRIFREAFPDIEIRSVTSGFPSAELGVAVAHPAFPHEINKIWEVVEPEPSAVTRLLWALGLIPVPVSDHWSFVLDVLFCGITLAALRYHDASNVPFWKVDKLVRKLAGPNPFRAHDVIGSKGADFLTWSCLHHLSQQYGDVFTPTADLVERKETGESWYPPNHFRPLVDWKLDGEDEEIFRTWVLGPLFHMTSLLVHERRSHFANLNAIGELCAQFRKGALALAREHGADEILRIVGAYHELHPEAAGAAWHPEAFEAMDTPEWQQLYVNAEHDGEVGVVTLSRETYDWEVDAELNRAVDWLRAEGIERVILTGDFHLSTQMVGADTADFFPALEETEAGLRICEDWSRTARRFHEEFHTSVGVVNGKRCLGGMLELLLHCHYVVAVHSALLGMPEVTLPVVPGMEGCHWPFRKSRPEDWPRVLRLLLSGEPVRAPEAVGWLVDYAGPLEATLSMAWTMATGGADAPERRPLEADALEEVPREVAGLSADGGPVGEAAAQAIVECVQGACGAPLGEALARQARHAAGFLSGPVCRKGEVGGQYTKTMAV